MVITPKQTTPANKPSQGTAKAKGKSSRSSKAAARAKSIDDDSDEDFVHSADMIDDDEDDSDVVEVDDSDSDDVAPAKKKRASAAASKAAPKARARVTLVSDDDEDKVIPAPKARARATPTAAATKTPASQPSKASAPSSGRQLPTSLEKPKATPKARAPKAAPPPLDPSAVKAMAAVDAAVKALPAADAVKMSVMQPVEGFGGGGHGDAPPPNHGAKDAPNGHPDALTGKTFVISGVLDSMYRHEAEDYIKRHGGRVTSAVSGKTTFLLCGESTGNSKFNAAKEKKVTLIDEDGLFSLVSASIPFVPAKPEPPTPATASAPSFYGSSAAGPSMASGSGAGPSRAAAAVAPATGSDLWVDKWKPKTAADLVGNPGHLNLMRQWLRDWDRVHLRHEKAGPAPGAQSAKKDMSKKAILLSGPPGIGKTTAAHIITRELGFDPVEVNASDTRNKADAKTKDGIAGKLSNRIKELVTNTAIGAGDGSTNTRKQVIVMDEVDGMSGGDRGGVADLINSIKVSKLPIICICNDKYKQSLKSLRNHCMELEWRKPTKQQVAQRLNRVCQAEGLQLNAAAMDALVEGAQGDMRMMLGQLQMARLRATSLSYDDVKRSSSKDSDMSPFECARQLLAPESAVMSLADRMDLTFQDMDLIPLLVQENYLNHRPSMATNEATAMQVYAKAADAISAGDVVNKRVRMNQEWHLMPHAGLMSAVFPASYVRGRRDIFGLYPGEMNFPRFTSWMGNNSSTNKWRRVCGELTTKMLAAGVVADRRDLRLQYLPVLRRALTQPLVKRGEEGIPDVIELMQTYLISREDFDSVLDLTKFKTQSEWGSDPMKAVETRTKSAFTRAFNKEGLPIKTSIMVDDFKKGKSKKAAPVVVDDDDELGGELAEAAAVMKVDEEDEEEVNVDDLKTKGIDIESALAKGKKGAAASGKGRKGAGRGGKAAGRASTGGRGKK